ncbi:hypothetical protein [Bradyrhizobium sp. RT3b]|uniref:hypothetical protein n=1 Tax=Bradyrhizobium sp. RT3b TaxID=3156334 RepID=UPI0033907B6B
MFTSLLDLSEFQRLDAIHKEEELAGVYEQPFKISSSSRKAEDSNNRGFKKAFEESNDLYGYLQDQRPKVINSATRYAYMQHMWSVMFVGQQFLEYKSYEHDYPGDAIGSKSVQDHSEYAAKIQYSYNQDVTLRNARAQVSLASSQCDTSDERLQGLLMQEEWDKKNVDFQRRRTVVAREHQDLKLWATTAPEGPLNSYKRLAALKTLFNSDFRDAIARLNVACSGLNAIYGLNRSLPVNTGSESYFEEVLVFTRDCIQHQLRFSQRDQQAVIPISLRTLIGNDRFIAGVKARSIDFSLPSSFFERMAHVRIRGVSAYFVGKREPSNLLKFDLKAPIRGEFYHMDGTLAIEPQSHLPHVKLTRISKRDYVREPDIYAVSALRNASPIGGWSLRNLANCLNSSEPDVDDIIIDLHLAFREA